MEGGSRPFGRRVRLLRLALGLTQAELAERSDISERTVSDLERGLRNSVYPATARRLAAALLIEPGELSEFLLDASGNDEQGGLLAQVAALPSTYRSRVPAPLTRLIGRQEEVSAVLRLVRNPGSRLVTLVGPGGVGKTRLAIEVGSVAQPEFAAGTYFAGLSGIDDPELVLPFIATTVGLQPTTGELVPLLAARFRSGSALLILDTFEHVAAAAPAIVELLAACSGLTVLVTSRSSLRLRGEREFPVPPLALGPVDAITTAPSPAVELFLDRAVALAPGLPVTLTNLEIISDICARLDGLPLAIELAAARVKHMPLTELRADLQHRLDALVGGPVDLPARHQTMRAALDWSYALLGEPERRLFRRLSVLRGGFGLDAVQALAADDDRFGSTDDLSTISGLADSSLVLFELGDSGLGRYRMLEVVRAYAVERAMAAGEIEQLRLRHAQHFVLIAERAEPELRGSRQRTWFSRLQEDEGNFRAALGWALGAGEAELALRLGAALWMFWRWAGLFAEGRAWLDAALAACERCPPELRYQGLWGAGWLAYHHGDYRHTEALGRQMLAALPDTDPSVYRRNALTLVGNAALAAGRHADAIVTLEQALAVCEKLGTPWYLGTSLLNLGTALLTMGRVADARRQLLSAQAIYQELGDQHFAARVFLQLGYADLVAGDAQAAAKEVRRGMAICAGLGDGWSIAEGLEATATVLSQAEPRCSAILAGAAAHLRDRISMRPHPADALINASQLDRARDRLGPDDFAAAWREGWNASLNTAVRLAQGEGHDR